MPVSDALEYDLGAILGQNIAVYCSTKLLARPKFTKGKKKESEALIMKAVGDNKMDYTGPAVEFLSFNKCFAKMTKTCAECCGVPSLALLPPEVASAYGTAKDKMGDTSGATGNMQAVKDTKDKAEVVKALLSKQKWEKVDDAEMKWEVSFDATTKDEEKLGAILYVLQQYSARSS